MLVDAKRVRGLGPAAPAGLRGGGPLWESEGKTLGSRYHNLGAHPARAGIISPDTHFRFRLHDFPS